jgi:hypothetical protein
MSIHAYKNKSFNTAVPQKNAVTSDLNISCMDEIEQ